MVALNKTINHVDLTNKCRTLHSTIADYTSFSSTHETFFKLEYMLAHETSLKNFKI